MDIDKRISDFEKRKNEIREYLVKLDETCKSRFGPMNKYQSPKKNPYKYSDLNAYKEAVLGEDKSSWKFEENKHVKKNCKFNPKPSRNIDANKRYFTEIDSELDCKKVEGFWDSSSVNRKNKFEKGVCWYTKQDRECAKQTDGKLLKPYHSKFIDQTGKRIEETEKCHQVPGCAWKQQSEYTWDCVKGKRDNEDNGPVMNPPHDMPHKDGLEEYVFRWYKSDDAPLTTELIGEGNRCNGIVQEDNIDPPDKFRVKEYIDHRLLNPHNERDSSYLKDVLNKDSFRIYMREWDELQRIGAVRFNELYATSSLIYDFYNKMEYQQMMDDNSIETAKKRKIKGFHPSVPQSIVNMVMKHTAQNNGSKRGMLAWHSTGSGKTCTATGVIDSFWDTDRPIIFASSIDAIASNPDYKFHECAMNLYPRFQQGEFRGKSKAESMALIAAAFKRRNVRFLSFAKLSNRVLNAEEYKKLHKLKKGGAGKKTSGVNVAKINKEVQKKKVIKKDVGVNKAVVGDDKVVKTVTDKKVVPKVVQASKPVKVQKGKSHEDILSSEAYVDLDNAVLIIDEVHNLFRPLPNQKKEHERLEREILDPRKHPNMKVVILTATPGDNIPDVLKLLNIIRDPKEPPIRLDNIESEEDIKKFKDGIRGMISYFDMSNDITKFPIVNDPQVFIKAPMSEIQFNKYLEAYKSIKGEQKNYDALAKDNKLSKYWEAARKYSNMLFNFDKDMKLSDFSAKMPFLLENIKQFQDEKHYVYSSFYTKMGYGGQGIVSIAKELEKKGYKKLEVKEAKRLNAAGKLPSPAKRYILAITTEIGEEGGSAGKNLHELIKIYNSPENKNGELIHVMLASQGFNEGIDLKAVRHIHFFEPLVTMASDKQTLGRAARYCSHADLDKSKGDWRVQIHRYMSDKPDLSMAVDNTKLILQLEQDIKDIKSRILDNDASSYKSDLQDKIKRLKEVIRAKTKAKQDTSFEKKEVVALEGKIQSATNNSKGALKIYKDELRLKEKQYKSLTTIPKKKVIDPSSVANIEEVIFKESRERMKELLIVYQCMKEAAVDCKILSEFHSLTGHKVNCTF